MILLRRLLALLILLFVLPAIVQAQKVWSLEDCINYALTNNIQIKQQRLSLKLQEYTLLQSKTQFLPSLNGNVYHGYNFGKTVDRYTNSFAEARVQSDNFSISSQMTLFNGFTLLNTLSKNKLLIQSGKYDVEKMQNDICLNLASGYLNILFNQELLANAEGQLAITQQQVGRTKTLVEVGTLAKGNLLNIEAQAAAEELQKVTAENQLKLSYLILAQILDFRSADSFDIVRPSFAVPDKPVIASSPNVVYALALETQPQVKSAEILIETAEKDLAIARGNASPSITFQGSWSTGYSGASQEVSGYTYGGLQEVGYVLPDTSMKVVSPIFSPSFNKITFENQINDNQNKSLGFFLTIPIFNGLQQRTNISRAKIGIENARLNLEQTKNTLNQDIQRSHADAIASINKYKAAKKSVDAMEEAFFYMQQKFDVGMVNSVDYNEAKKNLSKSQSDMLQAKYEYVFKKTILDFYMGKPIVLN